MRHRKLRVDMQGPDGDMVSTIASPLRLKGTPPVYDRPPPRLGDSTDDVLRDLLGCSEETIASYRKQGLV
ncbi:Formyl-CoA:oxalate CoA-transferase [compost metagenome]